jgi:hypothetical protein
VLGDKRLHAITVGAEFRAVGVDVRVEAIHYHPQQSVLNRQEGQRHTACMRYMSAPHRSHFMASSAGVAGGALNADGTGLITRRTGGLTGSGTLQL